MGSNCTRICRGAGGAIGFAVFLWLLLISGTSLLAALFFGIIAGFLMAGLLVWGLCDGRGSAEENAALLAASFRPEPFTATVRVVAPGGETVSHAPAAEAGPLPEGPPREQVSLRRGDAASRIGQPGEGSEPAGTPATPAAVVLHPAPAAEGPQVVDVPPPAVAPPAPPADAHAAQHPVNNPSEDAALASAGAAAPAADSEAGAAGADEGGIVPLRQGAGAGEPPAVAAPAEAPPAAANDDGADDLERIRGIGPMLRNWLAENGVTRLEQIAAWDDADITRFSVMMGRLGHRIRSEDWVGQARALMAADREGRS